MSSKGGEVADGKAANLKEFTIGVCCGCTLPHRVLLYWGASYPHGGQKLIELLCVGFVQNSRDLGLIQQKVVSNVTLQHEVVVCLFSLTHSLYFSFDLQ